VGRGGGEPVVDSLDTDHPPSPTKPSSSRPLARTPGNLIIGASGNGEGISQEWGRLGEILKGRFLAGFKRAVGLK